MLYIASARRLGIHVPQESEVLSINKAQFFKKKCVYPLQIYISTYFYIMERWGGVKKGGGIHFFFRHILQLIFIQFQTPMVYLHLLKIMMNINL